MIATDMDGTLLTEAKGIAPRTAALIRQVTAAGIRLVLASARPHCSARRYADELGLDTPLVCYNGALLKGADGRELLSRPLATETAAALARFARRRGLYIKVYGDDVFFVEEPSEKTARYSSRYFIPFRAIGELAPFIAAERLSPYAVVIHTAPDNHAETTAEVEMTFAGRVNCHCPNEHAIHISAADASKLGALQLLADSWGIKREEVLAIGDGSNDLEMVTWAGTGVAVANAAPELLRAADWVAPAEGSLGVAQALERFTPPASGRRRGRDR